MRPALILFARAPVPGRVKTRLAAALGLEAATVLHSAFVRDMLEKTSSMGALADIQLHTDKPTDAWADIPVTRQLQAAGSLELKMFHALEAALAEGRSRAMIVGTDAPSVPVEHLRELLASRCDVAFGPCDDGGYYAISCRRIDPGMFRGVPWSCARTLLENERAAARCGLSTARGPAWFDVDEPADLAKLLRSPALPRHTAAAALLFADAILEKPR